MLRQICILFSISLALGFEIKAQETTPAPAPNTYPNKTTKAIPISETPKIRVGVRLKRQEFVLGGELRSYKYSEPGFVTHEGFMYGAYTDYLYRFNSSTSISAGGNLIFGVLNYDGGLCDEFGNCQPYKATTNDLITRAHTKVHISPINNFSLQIGLGIRYLSDKGQGQGFYQRTGNWIYVPVAVGFSAPLVNKAKLNFLVEYDVVVSGGIRSNLSEVDPDYSDVYMSQTGNGLILKAGYDWKQFKISAFYETWRLNESAPVSTGGATFIEPANQSQSIGLQLGLDLL
jgi:hypothetical protein